MTQVTIAALIAVALNAADTKEVKLVGAVNSLVEKLTKATEGLDTYRAERAAREAALNIPEGTEGTFVFGRAETAKTLTGKVIAVVETGSGNLLKVLAGEGKELRVYDVASSKFTPVVAEQADSAQLDLPLDQPAGETLSGDTALTDLLTDQTAADAAVYSL